MILHILFRSRKCPFNVKEQPVTPTFRPFSSMKIFLSKNVYFVVEFRLHSIRFRVKILVFFIFYGGNFVFRLICFSTFILETQTL